MEFLKTLLKGSQIILAVKFPLSICMIILGIFTLARNSDAKSIYVSVNGNDSVAYADNDISHPWQTPGKAWTNARAGDTVYFRGGTYVITSQISTWSSGYDGTAENPITFTAYPGETPILDSSGSSLYPMFRIEKNYNVVDGLTLKSQHSMFTLGYETGKGSGFVFKNNRATMTVGDSDNSGIIQVYAGPSNFTITNNLMIGPGTNCCVSCTINCNVAGIWFSYTEGPVLVKNNDISGFPSGIYFKHPNTLTDSNIEYSYNYIHDCGWGIHSVANYALIRHNLLRNNTQAIYTGDYGGGGAGCQNITYAHNTLTDIMGFTVQEFGSCNNPTLTDNLFKATNSYNSWNPLPTGFNADYNLYPTGNITFINNTYYTLSDFRTLLGGCPGANNECNSLSASPTFVGGTSPSTISGFALAAGSAGKNAASDGTDMGANISMVGTQANSPDTTPPAAPTGLAVR